MQVPYASDEEKFNITIRAISEYGAGIPIYINLNLNEYPSEVPSNMRHSAYDPSLGIAIGLLLSIICIIICMWIIIRHQSCAKARNQLHMNGANSNGNHQRTMNETTTAMVFPTVNTNLTANSVIDLHEIQSLMTKSTDGSLTAKMNGGANGIIKRCENTNNGIVCSNGSNDNHAADQPILSNNSHEYSLDSSDENDSDFDDYNEISCRNLISSTPKHKQQQQQQVRPTEHENSSSRKILSVSMTDSDNTHIQILFIE